MAKSTTPPPVWFVTGCSTGFGREFARAALAHGFRVVATARDPKTLDNLIAGHRDKAIALTLDVTNPDQIKKAVIEAEHAFGRIDVLVNNAAMAIWPRWRKGGEGYSCPIRHQLLRLGRNDPRGPAGNAGAPGRHDRQHRLGRRSHRLCRLWQLCGYEIRGRGPVGIALSRGRAIRDPCAAGRARPVSDGLGRTILEAIADSHQRL